MRRSVCGPVYHGGMHEANYVGQLDSEARRYAILAGELGAQDILRLFAYLHLFCALILLRNGDSGSCEYLWIIRLESRRARE
jgi:hypothetical protein